MNGSSIGDENNRGNFDMGEDARQASNNLHQRFGADAAAYTLGYYQGDYKSITSNPAIANMPPQYSTDLYNGNISYKISSLSNLSGQPLDVQASTYRYDQLNRLKSADIFTAPNLLSSNQITNPLTSNRYKTSYSYDANGNISDLQRHDDQGSLIDHLSYHYHKKANGYSDDKNQLLYVDDAVSTPNLNTDLEDQEPGNYAYDATGNLIKDESAEIAQISWTAYGKVSEVIRSSGSTMPNLSFQYDASGNRVLKIVKPYNYLNDSLQWKYEYYVRDASGNILAVYEKSYDTQQAKQTLVLTEQPFYGSARLGVINRNLQVNPGDTAASQYTRVMGKKTYLLSDFLGNVNVVLSDRKIAVEDPANPGIILHYRSDVISYSDYFPFGSVKPGRNGSVGIGPRYLFNGMEQDRELSGNGNSYTTFYRQYDPRLGRWLSPDPLASNFPWQSPYIGMDNNPVLLSDPFGDCTECPDGKKEGQAHTSQEKYISPTDGIEIDRPVDWNYHSGSELADAGWYQAKAYQDIINGMGQADGMAAENFAVSTQWFSDDTEFTEGWEKQFSETYKNGFAQGIANSKYMKSGAIEPFNIDVDLLLAPVAGASLIKFLRGGIAKGVTNILKPLGRGSTGRTVARSMSERWAMKFAKDNPQLGEVVIEHMGDQRWLGWSKMQYIHRPVNGGRTVTIHYVGKFEKGVLKAVDDFKFK